MYYTIYKITNTVNKKEYIGKHKTDNLDDEYMGSGKLLKRAQNKYGIDKFTKEILFVFDTMEEMDKKERELVNEDFINDTNTYNLTVGGSGGFYYVNANLDLFPDKWKAGAQARADKLKKLLEDDNYRKEHSKRISEGLLNSPNRSKLGRNQKGKSNNMFGKTHTDEAKIGMSKNKTGDKNAMFGMCWVHSLIEKRSTRVPKDKVQEYIDSGWILGRKMKF